jgi:subtilisin-like proprotein convertase family protein
VALAAPGVNIYSTVPGGYATLSGTSMATPMVSGVMALVWSQHPAWTYTQVINQVLSTVTKETGLNGKVRSGGILNAAAAVGAVSTTNAPPRIIGSSASGPATNTLSQIQLTFDRAIALSSFTVDDLELLGPGGQIGITGVKVVSGSGDRIFLISFATQTAPGNYTLYVGSNATDLSGNRLTPYSTQFKLPSSTPPTTTPPHIVSSSASGPATNTLSQIQLTFDRAIALSSFTVADLGLLGPAGQIGITSVKVVSGSGDRTFLITFATQTAPGNYTLYVGSNATDVSGNRITPYSTQFKLPSTPPTTSPAHIVSSSASGPSANTLSQIQLTFDRAIALSSFTVDDLGLLGPKGQIGITGVRVVSGSGDRTFLITFATQTAAGNYTLYVGSNATDVSGGHIAASQVQFKIVVTTPSSMPPPASQGGSFASTAAAAIPSSGRVGSLLTVNQNVTIGTLTVTLNIAYPQIGDLNIHLQGPDGTDIVLSSRMGGAAAGFANVTFADSAATSIGFAAGPFKNVTYRPLGTLSAYAGKNAKGTWTLWVENLGGSTRTGTVTSWSVHVAPKA